MTVWRSQPGYYEQQYEALRREALDPAERQGHGLTLFLTRGMVAWMKALTVLQSPVDGSLQMSESSGIPCRDFSSTTLGGELTQILAEMVLACYEESHV